jgi:hypothetical protein
MHCLYTIGLLNLLLGLESCECFEQLKGSTNLSDSGSFCLPNTYRKDIRPDTESPLEIFVHLDILDILHINDYDKTITMKLRMSISWTENRLQILSNSSEWISGSGDERWTRLNSLWMQNIWTPEVEIVNMKEFKASYFLNRFSYLDLYESKTFWYNFPAEITIECPLFTFESYPLDIQSCELIIKSYQYYETEIHYSGAIAYNAKNQRLLQYQLKSFKQLGSRRSIFTYKEYWLTKDGDLTSGYYNSSCVVSRIKLERSIQRHMVRTYLPTSLFVLSSWIGFLIDADAIPGRIALSVTLLLVLTQIRYIQTCYNISLAIQC